MACTRRLASPAACGLVLFHLACGGPDPGSVRLPAPSFDRFASTVQPILERRCSSPSCHGSGLRPLSLYAPLRRRSDPARLHRPEPCTAEEVRANYEAIRGLLPDPFLCKTLALGAGGCFHGAGPIWSSADELEFEVLRSWAETGW